MLKRKVVKKGEKCVLIEGIRSKGSGRRRSSMVKVV